ncbi:MAG: hypothetical protein K9M49_02165 [Candidatus Marinimicrobia bacterium]|nr:hypothetical protein [Candidatus Neomarinimicrobiota bacterium]MCF7903936.1 hypothetical protein [Candidatus Neomarinimicrobiota bacterium]
MNNHRTIRLLISMLTLIGLMGCAMPTKVRMHPDLVNEPGKIKTITLLPIDAQVKKLELSSTGERDQEKELEIIEQSSLVIPNILSSQGYQVTPYMIPYDAVESELFHQNYDELRAAYFSEMPRLYDGQKVS